MNDIRKEYRAAVRRKLIRDWAEMLIDGILLVAAVASIVLLVEVVDWL